MDCKWRFGTAGRGSRFCICRGTFACPHGGHPIRRCGEALRMRCRLFPQRNRRKAAAASGENPGSEQRRRESRQHPDKPKEQREKAHGGAERQKNRPSGVTRFSGIRLKKGRLFMNPTGSAPWDCSAPADPEQSRRWLRLPPPVPSARRYRQRVSHKSAARPQRPHPDG